MKVSSLIWGWMGTGAQRIGAIVAALFGTFLSALVDDYKTPQETIIYEPQPGRHESLLRKLNARRHAGYKWLPVQKADSGGSTERGSADRP